jgi:membrane-associated phospholipid phosphatase
MMYKSKDYTGKDHIYHSGIHFIFNKQLALLIFLQLFVAVFYTNAAFAQTDTVPKLTPTSTPIDDRILLDLASKRTPEETRMMKFVSKTYMYGNIGVPAALLAGGVITGDKEMRQNALYVASSSLVNFCLTQLIKRLVKRPRPYIHNITIKSVYEAQGYSFPSGHTSSTFTTAMSLSMAYHKWYVIAPSFLWAGTVGYSRMYLGVHYPTDVGTGAVLGVGSAVGMGFLRK